MQSGEDALPDSRTDKKQAGICVEKGCYFDIRDANPAELRANKTPSTCSNCCELNKLRQRRLRASKRVGKPNLKAKKEEETNFKKIRHEARLGPVTLGGIDAMPLHYASARVAPDLVVHSPVAAVSPASVTAVDSQLLPAAAVELGPADVNAVRMPAAAMPSAAAPVSSRDATELDLDVADFYTSYELFPLAPVAETQVALHAFRVEVNDVDRFIN